VKKVVDANLLRHPSLEEYLREDSGNYVVFTDYACMECYKGNAISNIQRSLQIVSKYPEQVIVLKGTLDIIRLQAGGPHVQDEFIDFHPVTSGISSVTFVRPRRVIQS